MSMSQQTPSPLDKVRSDIQLAGFHYIACMKACPTNADCQLTIEKITYTFDVIRRTDTIKLHAEFQHWAATAVLRDLIESFSVFLMKIYRDAALANPGVTYSNSLAQFERKGLEDQLTALANDFVIDDAWTTRLVGYNKARNCLAHRQGIVGPRDTTDRNELVVRWLMPKVGLIDGPIMGDIDVEGPMGSLIRAEHVRGGSARAEILDKEKRFSLGSPLTLMPTDILEICQTFQMAAAAFSAISSPS